MSTTTSNLGLFKYDNSDYDKNFDFSLALNGNWDKIDSNIDLKNIIVLGTSGTQILYNNRFHKISCSGNVTFSLPTGSPTSFKQILVLLYMSSAYTINLGTSYYFNGITPNMTASGYYTIIYEYDSIRTEWTVGVLKK